MNLYYDPAWQGALETAGFANFEQIWSYPIDWIDTPNQNRGGWSGVGCVKVVKDGKAVTLFVKKQQNHNSRSLLHPIKGEPTFLREYEVLRYFKAQGINVPEVVFFGQRHSNDGQQAILITELLEGYQSLDIFTQTEKKRTSLFDQKMLISSVAEATRRMHSLGFQHRALYPKHIFIKPSGISFDVAFIDLEKSRRMIFSLLQSVNDLITLNYRTLGWSCSHRLYFFREYYSINRLKGFYKILYCWVVYKTRQKQSQWNNKNE